MKKITQLLLLTALVIGCQTNENKKEEVNRNYLPSSWSTVGFRSLCAQGNQQMASSDDVKLYDGKIFYNKKIRDTETETQISFDFIAERCGSYLGKHEIINEVLYLTYYPDPSSLRCEGKCDYRMIFTFVHNNQSKKNWKSIVIRKGFKQQASQSPVITSKQQQF